MFLAAHRRRIARSIVAVIAAGFIQVGLSAPVAFAAPLAAPTISSVTATATSLTVNMQTSGVVASSWRYILTRQKVSGCANPLTDTAVNTTGSLVSSFTIIDLTAGCHYTIKVAAYNGAIGAYSAADKLVGGYTNGLLVYTKNEAGLSAAATRLPFTTGICSSAGTIVANIDLDYGSTGPNGCNVDGFTSYYVGYIKAPYTGNVTFKNSSDDGFILNIQGQNVINYAAEGAATLYNSSGTISMVANEVYRIEAWHHEYNGNSVAKLYWEWSGQTIGIVPSSSFATDPSVLRADGGCPVGTAARCAAGSALEIKRATGTNMDGQYWIMIDGNPTLVFCIMNSTQGGGGWMLAMRGKNASSTFQYNSSYWTNSTLLNESYPQRFSSSDAVDTYRNTDAKYAPFASLPGNQVMVLYPEVTDKAGGAFGTNGSANASGVNSVKYGFAWHETFTTGTAWTSYNSTTKWGGNSWNIAQTGGPTATPACVTTAKTLNNLFNEANRCAFRRVSSNYVSTESPYSAVGDNVFFSQTNVRFFGINYGNGSTTYISKARIGFGWNENGPGEETSNDGNGGIGLYSTNSTTIAAGTFNGCCSATVNAADANTAGQTGLSGGDGTTRQLGFELYVRNSTELSLSGHSNLNVTKGRSSSLVAARGYYAGGNTGTTTIRLSSVRDGFTIDPTSGVITVSEALPAGSYPITISATDGNAAVGITSATINVIADSSETDTALSFNGTSQWVENVGTFGTSGDFTYEAWVKPNYSCSQTAGHNKVISTANLYISCWGGNWYFSYTKADGSTPILEMSQKVVPNEWVHLAVVRTNSGSTGETYFYYNNKQISFYVNGWVSSIPVTSFKGDFTNIKIGGTGTANQYFNGLVDEVKVWQRARSLADIWAGAHTQQSLYEDLLLLMYDFNEASGNAISRAQRGDYQITLGTVARTSVATTSTDGPYTLVTVPRTLINSIGGWRAPDSVTAITALVLGGGGGGGGGYQGGGGGAGGFLESTVTIDPKNTYPIRVGVGGLGTSNPVSPTNGDTSTAFGMTALGGGAGGAELVISGAGVVVAHTSGGSGGGGGWASGGTGSAGTAGQGFAGGNAPNLEGPTCSPNQYAAAGGGGAGGAGFAPTCLKGGNGGAPKLSAVTGTLLAGGGGGSLRSATSISNTGYGSNELVNNGGNSGYVSGALVGATGGATNGAPGTGTGGGAGMSADGTTGYGAAGGSGIVTFRWITAQKPSFTQPRNAFLNAGMTETFSVNVASDSATARLTRTFRWESTTAGSSGTYSVIKQGTGAANASFSWVPQDTATSGSQFLFRVIVTDSDTAGLFIQDTSTAVFATINQALRLSSKSTLTKTAGVSKTETFTVTLGTPSYSYTLSPDGPNFWLDTSTVGSPRIRFSDTVTVGTYYETFTVTDSVSASVVVPLTIIVSPPPSFSANAAQVDSGTVLYLDAGNTSSFSGSGNSWSDLSGRGLTANLQPTSLPVTNGPGPSSCTRPTFNPDSIGSFTFSSGAKNCAYISNLGLQTTYTVQAWVYRDGNQTDYSGIVATPWDTGKQINISLHWITNDKLQAGIWKNTSWGTFATSNSIPNRTWTFVTVTFNGSALSMTVNGGVGSKFTGTPNAGAVLTESLNYPGLIIGKRFDLDADYMNGGISTIRIYNRVLSDSEILQNYDTTQGRFIKSQNKQAVAGKYGTTVNETYTVTAGSETITATFTTTAIAGLVWDTSTVRSMRVQLQESLTAGTYLDTVTVTDIYGTSTRLPLTFTIAKADTLTVWIDTPTALSYTGFAASFATPLRITGLVSSDTGTAVSSISYRPAGTSCATGGVCAIGDIGPGGGVVFITPSTPGGNGKYFEAAPSNWTGTDDTVSIGKFCTGSTSQDGISRSATQFGIGWGDTNTALFGSNCTGGAVKQAMDYAGGGYTDWFIPNTNEAAQLHAQGDRVGLIKLGGNWTTGTWGYWASTEQSGTQMKIISLNSGSWSIGAAEKSESTRLMVRPVRMFSPCWAANSCSSEASTTKPTNAGTYAIAPTGLSLSRGNLSNYIAIKYETTTVTIDRINQSALQIPYYNPTYPETMTMYLGGGSGSGHLTFSITNGGTATGCAFDYRKLYTTSVGTCNVQVVKAGDRNYLPETSTAFIYFIQFVISQPAPTTGGGPGIALSGETAITRDPNAAPTISAVVTSYSCLITCTASWDIQGSGFGASFNTSTIVKFWRNKVVTLGGNGTANYVVSDTSIRITEIPAGATTGKITVTTANGIAVSIDNWIAP